jgi:hypothetical protein
VEIALNLAWALCSLTMVWYWMRTNASNPAPRGVQAMALGMVVLLLLPVISLSDDLMAMQGPAETDTCVRRALHPNEGHPPVVPVSFATPEQVFAAMPISGYSQMVIQAARLAPAPRILNRSLDRRPPPQA